MATATVTERGICRVCSKSVKLRVNGKVGKHGLCQGEGRKPKRSNKRRATAPKKTVTTHVALLIDASGSMSGVQNEAFQALQNTLTTVALPDYMAYVYSFDDDVRPLAVGTPATQVSLNRHQYKIRGCTALNDAIMQAIKDMESRADNGDCFLVVVITDGEENRSHTTTKSVKAAIKRLTATDKWTFAFSGPVGCEKYAENCYGISPGNITTWEQTRHGTQAMGHANVSAATSYTQARTAGKTQVSNFYVNIGREKVTDVAKNLQPVPHGRFRELTTGKACQIQEFIESKKLHFKPGCAYYQLQKPETIQDYKQVILQRNDTGERFMGPEARAKIGLPTVGKARVKPGNLGEWTIWVQSTSNNRKLLAKMKVLFDKQA
jgi:hypothetical protein